MEIKNLLTSLGYQPDDIDSVTESDVVAHINKNFIKKETAHLDDEVAKRFVGKTFSKIYTVLEGFSDLPKNKLKEIPGDEAVQTVLTDLSGKVTTLQSELDQERENSKKGSDKQVSELKQQLEDKARSIADFEKANRELQETLKATTADYQQKFIGKVQEFEMNKALSGIEFHKDVDELRKAGFDTIISQKYQFGMEGEGDQLEFVARDKSGERVSNPKKAGEFLSPADVIKMEAEERKLLKNSEQDTRPPAGGGAGTPDQSEKKFKPRAALKQ